MKAEQEMQAEEDTPIMVSHKPIVEYVNSFVTFHSHMKVEQEMQTEEDTPMMVSHKPIVEYINSFVTFHSPIHT